MIMCGARNIVVLFQCFSLFKKYWASFKKIWGLKRTLVHFVNRKHPLLVSNFNQCLYHLSFRKIQFLSKSADCFWILKKGRAHQIVIQTTQMSDKDILKLWKVNKYERIKVVTDTFFNWNPAFNLVEIVSSTHNFNSKKVSNKPMFSISFRISFQIGNWNEIFRYQCVSVLRTGYTHTHIYIIYIFITLYFIISNKKKQNLKYDMKIKWVKW